MEAPGVPTGSANGRKGNKGGMKGESCGVG